MFYGENFEDFKIRNFGDDKLIKNLIELKKNCLPLKFSQQLINNPLNFFENKENYNEIKKYKIIMNENNYMLYEYFIVQLYYSNDKEIYKKNFNLFFKNIKNYLENTNLELRNILNIYSKNKNKKIFFEIFQKLSNLNLITQKMILNKDINNRNCIDEIINDYYFSKNKNIQNIYLDFFNLCEEKNYLKNTLYLNKIKIILFESQITYINKNLKNIGFTLLYNEIKFILNYNFFDINEKIEKYLFFKNISFNFLNFFYIHSKNESNLKNLKLILTKLKSFPNINPDIFINHLFFILKNKIIQFDYFEFFIKEILKDLIKSNKNKFFLNKIFKRKKVKNYNENIFQCLFNNNYMPFEQIIKIYNLFKKFIFNENDSTFKSFLYKKDMYDKLPVYYLIKNKKISLSKELIDELIFLNDNTNFTEKDENDKIKFFYKNNKSNLINIIKYFYLNNILDLQNFLLENKIYIIEDKQTFSFLINLLINNKEQLLPNFIIPFIQTNISLFNKDELSKFFNQLINKINDLNNEILMKFLILLGNYYDIINLNSFVNFLETIIEKKINELKEILEKKKNIKIKFKKITTYLDSFKNKKFFEYLNKNDKLISFIKDLFYKNSFYNDYYFYYLFLMLFSEIYDKFKNNNNLLDLIKKLIIPRKKINYPEIILLNKIFFSPYFNKNQRIIFNLFIFCFYFPKKYAIILMEQLKKINFDTINYFDCFSLFTEKYFDVDCSESNNYHSYFLNNCLNIRNDLLKFIFKDFKYNQIINKNVKYLEKLYYIYFNIEKKIFSNIFEKENNIENNNEDEDVEKLKNKYCKKKNTFFIELLFKEFYSDEIEKKINSLDFFRQIGIYKENCFFICFDNINKEINFNPFIYLIFFLFETDNIKLNDILKEYCFFLEDFFMSEKKKINEYEYYFRYSCEYFIIRFLKINFSNKKNNANYLNKFLNYSNKIKNEILNNSNIQLMFIDILKIFIKGYSSNTEYLEFLINNDLFYYFDEKDNIYDLILYEKSLKKIQFLVSTFKYIIKFNKVKILNSEKFISLLGEIHLIPEELIKDVLLFLLSKHKNILENIIRDNEYLKNLFLIFLINKSDLNLFKQFSSIINYQQFIDDIFNIFTQNYLRYYHYIFSKTLTKYKQNYFSYILQNANNELLDIIMKKINLKNLEQHIISSKKLRFYYIKIILERKNYKDLLKEYHLSYILKFEEILFSEYIDIVNNFQNVNTIKLFFSELKIIKIDYYKLMITALINENLKLFEYLYFENKNIFREKILEENFEDFNNVEPKNIFLLLIIKNLIDVFNDLINYIISNKNIKHILLLFNAIFKEFNSINNEEEEEEDVYSSTNSYLNTKFNSKNTSIITDNNSINNEVFFILHENQMELYEDYEKECEIRQFSKNSIYFSIQKIYNNNFYFILSILKLISYKKIINIFLHHNNNDIFLSSNNLKLKIFYLNCYQFLNQYKEKKINNTIFNDELNNIFKFILFLISKKSELSYQKLTDLIQLWIFFYTENFFNNKENFINFIYENNYDYFLFICYIFIMNLKQFPIFLLKKDYLLSKLNENIILDILVIFEIMKFKIFEIKYNFHNYYKKIVLKITDFHNENKNILNQFKKIFKSNDFDESFKKFKKYFDEIDQNYMLTLFYNNKKKLGYLFLTKSSDYNNFINYDFYEEKKNKIINPYFLTNFYFKNRKSPIFNQLIELIQNDLDIYSKLNICYWYEIENLNSQCKKYIDKIFNESNSIMKDNFFDFIQYLKQHISTIQHLLNNKFYEDFFYIQENSNKLEEINKKINMKEIFFYFLEKVKKTETIIFFDNFYDLFYYSKFIINEMKKNSNIPYKNFLNKILIHMHFILNLLYYLYDSFYIPVVSNEYSSKNNIKLKSLIQFNFIQVGSNENKKENNENKENIENLLNCIDSLLKKEKEKKYIINIYYIFDNLTYKEVSTQTDLQFYINQFLNIINDLIFYIFNNIKNPKILFSSFENNDIDINMIPQNKYEYYSLLIFMNNKDEIKKYFQNNINILKNKYNYEHQKNFFITLLSNKPIYGFNDLSSFISKIFNDKEYLIHYTFKNNYNFLDDNTFETYINIFQFYYNRYMELYNYFKQKITIIFVDFIDHLMNHNFFIDKKVDDKNNNFVKLKIFKKMFYNEYLLNCIKLCALNCYKLFNIEYSKFKIKFIFKYKKGKKIKKNFEKTNINDLLNFKKEINKKNKEVKIYVFLNQTKTTDFDFKLDDIYNEYFIKEYDSLFETDIIKQYNKEIKFENQL